MLKQIHKDLVEQVKKEGIAKCYITDILSGEDINKFNVQRLLGVLFFY